jgi:hypothetical protein
VAVAAVAAAAAAAGVMRKNSVARHLQNADVVHHVRNKGN